MGTKETRAELLQEIDRLNAELLATRKQVLFASAWLGRNPQYARSNLDSILNGECRGTNTRLPKAMDKLAVVIARAVLAAGDCHFGKCQRIQFMVGTYPDNERAAGGYNEHALAVAIKGVLEGHRP